MRNKCGYPIQGVGVSDQTRATNAPPVPIMEPPGLLAITVENVCGRAHRLHALASRVERIGDRIYGLQQSQGSAVTPAPDPKCDADRLHHALDNLDSAIERIEANLCRVEQL